MMNRMLVAPILALVLLLLLIACGRSPSANLYTLEAAHSGMVSSTGEGAAFSLGLRQVILPPVLKRPQIVLIEAERVTPLEFHRWSEPLDAAMARILSIDLRARLNSSSVLSYPWPSSFKPEQTLTIKIARFNGLPGKSVELTGVWLLSREEGGQPVRTERFHIVEQVAGTDYSALVRAHSTAVNRLADQLAEALLAQ
jgi:uncharacterized lipoprotein YmbA